MNDDELEIAILRRYISAYETARVDSPENKCARELDMRQVLTEVGSVPTERISAAAEAWLIRLAPPRQGNRAGPLKRCSLVGVRDGPHRFNARAFIDPGFQPPAPAWERLRELELRIPPAAIPAGAPGSEGKETEPDRDHLTQLLSRRALDTDLERLIADAAGEGSPLSVIMIDVDHFKRVNDSHGHPKGDEVLQGVARRVRSSIQGKGVAYRYGGEEFVAVLPNHDVNEAIAVAERVRVSVRSASVEGVPVTVSCGVCTLPDHGKSSAELVKAADVAMYDAKKRGRDLVRIFGEPDPPRVGPREPERKRWTSEALTEEEKEKLRKAYFNGIQLRCPQDGAILQVTERSYFGSAKAGLLVRCGFCGFIDTF